MSTRKTLDDPQDHAANPSPTKKRKKAKKALFGPPKPSNAIAEDQPTTPVQRDEDLLELDIGDLLDNFTLSKQTRNVNRYKKAFDNGLRLKREVTASDISAGPTSTAPTGSDGQPPMTGREEAHPEAETVESHADQSISSSTAPAGSDWQPTTTGREEAHHEAEPLTLEKHADHSLSVEVYDWQHAPLYSNRSFEVVNISSTLSWHKAKGVAGADSVSATFWNIKVRDKSLPDGPIFEVYGMLPDLSDHTKPPTQKKHQVRGGPLTTDILATQQDIRQLGDIVCQLLDRFPYNLDAQRWNRIVSQDWVAERRLVQARAIDLYSPSIDRTQLPPHFRELMPSTAPGEKWKSPEDTRTFMRAIRCLFDDNVFVDQVYKEKGQSTGHQTSQVTVLVNVDLLDPNKVNVLPDVPSGFSYKMSSLPKDVTVDKYDFSEDEEALVIRVFSYLQYKIAFKVGKPAAIVELARNEYHKLLKSDVNLDKLLRPAANLDKLPRPAAKLEHASSASRNRKKSPVSDLSFWWRPLVAHLHLKLAIALQNTANQEIPRVVVYTASRILLAYVCNQWISAYVNDKQNCLKSALATAIAADEVFCKQVDESQVKEAYCDCSDTASRTHTMHACMHCLKMFPCANLATTADSRRICEAVCARESSIVDSSIPMFRTAVKERINQSTHNNRVGESDIEGSTTKLCLETAYSFIVNRGEGEYKDAYSDHTRIDAMSLTDPQNTRSRPMFVSVDALHQMVLLKDHVVLHTPTNIVCTTMAVNYMKHMWGVHIVPAMLAAAQQTQKEKASGTRNSDWWQDWYICLDRLHHLCLLTPYTKESRLNLTSNEVDASTLQEFLECLRSSSWHKGQESPIHGFRPRRPKTDGENVSRADRDNGFIANADRLSTFLNKRAAAQLNPKEKPPVWRPWNAEERSQIQRVIKEIEADADANPAGLRMPRLAEDAPWPFRRDLIFSDDIDPWDWWFREMLSRYSRMWWLCDILHDTSESPMTLLLEIIVQWFARRGGIDQYIYCEMTPYIRHPLKYSFGRSANVKPGSPMRTGFTEVSPKSFRLHYERTRSTVVVQPWIINLLWSNYDPSEHQNIFQLLLSLAPVTEHYRAYKRDRFAEKPVYPKESSASRRLRLNQPADTDEPESDEDDDDQPRREDYDDGDDDEDEVTALDKDDTNVDKSSELYLEYVKLHDFTRDYFAYDETAQQYIDAFLAAARTGNSDSFTSSRRSFYLYIKAKCCVCKKRIVSGTLQRCRNQDHEQALFHEECVPDGLTMLCPPCREKDEHPTSVASTAMAIDSVCEHCFEKFHDEAALSLHIRDSHQALVQDDAFFAQTEMAIEIVCNHCSKKFEDEAALNVHIRDTHQAPQPIQPEHSAQSSTPATDTLQQLVLRLEQQQANLAQQQTKMEQQQAKMNEQQSALDKQQREQHEQQTQRQTKIDEQQSSIAKQQGKLDAKLQQQAALDEQQTKRQAKMNEQQSSIDEQQRELDAKLQKQKQQHKDRVQRELDMLAREEKQLQEWKDMMAKRTEGIKARADELRASLPD